MAVVRCYGAKRDTYDGRDERKVYAQRDVPSKYRSPVMSLDKYVDHVYDQGQLGSCTANALCGAYGLDLKKQEATLPGGYRYFNPSRLFLYYNTREDEGTVSSDAGASIRDTVKSLNRKGVCKEESWPYNIRYFRSKPSARAYDAAKGNNLCKYERLNQDIDQFRACLKDNCPFVFGFNVYHSFHSISSSGVMPLPTAYEKLGRPVGKHAVVAVGYSDDARCIIVLNSWGDDWGKGGYFFMPYDFIVDSGMCFDFWKITFACERGKPRPKDTVVWPGGSVGGSGGSYSYSGGGGGACGYGGVYGRASGYRYQ